MPAIGGGEPAGGPACAYFSKRHVASFLESTYSRASPTSLGAGHAAADARCFAHDYFFGAFASRRGSRRREPLIFISRARACGRESKKRDIVNYFGDDIAERAAPHAIRPDSVRKELPAESRAETKPLSCRLRRLAATTTSRVYA